MSSHVPFLAARPNEQFSTDKIVRDFADVNGILTAESDDMDLSHAPEAPVLPRLPLASRLPAPVQYTLVCIASLVLNIFLYSLLRDLLGAELASVSRDVTSFTQIALFLSYKLAGVSILWFAGYDAIDAASLAVLTNLPHYYMLSTFYTTSAFASILPLAIDVTSLAVPFAIFRRSLPAHDTSSPKTPNQEVAQDHTIFGLISLFGTAAYAVVIYGAFYTWLPAYMVVHFDGLKSLEKAHSTGLPLLVAILIPIGLASAQFLFAAAVGSPANPGLTDPKLKLNPETASLGQTVAWNLGFGPNGISPRGEILAKRTFALVTATFVNTFVRIYYTIDGTEFFGAAAWAALWSSAALLTGALYGWVGNE